MSETVSPSGVNPLRVFVTAADDLLGLIRATAAAGQCIGTDPDLAARADGLIQTLREGHAAAVVAGRHLGGRPGIAGGRTTRLRP
jgi:hypothetical protein